MLLPVKLMPLALILSFWKPCHPALPHYPEVRLGPTVITGLHSITAGGKPVHTFLGIRYGEAPSGMRRFKPPVLAELPQEVSAQRFGASCPQGPAYKPEDMSEDCLFLNVFAPGVQDDVSKQQLAPVLMWIHGGGFIVGGAGVYDVEELAGEGGVVVVTLNYRLGPLGFLSTGDSSSWGNYGLWDQQLALQWVHKHIGHFGGDKTRVTLAGVSAGAASASLHALSPLSRDLFHHMILMSGSATAPWARVSSDQALEAAKALGRAVGCQPMEQNISTQSLVNCLQAQPVERIVASSIVMFPDQVGLSLVDYSWGPVEDGSLVMDMDTVTAFPGPVLAGLVNNEGDTLTSWTVHRISHIIPQAEDLLRKRQFYNWHFLPTLLKQTYPEMVPLPWLATHHALEEDQAFKEPPFLEALQRLQCAYPLREGGGVGMGLGEVFGDQAFVLGTVEFLDKFCCSGLHKHSSYLYFVDYQTKRPGIEGFRHLDDLVFLFGFNFTFSRRYLGFDGHLTNLDLQLARDMRQLFINFIHTGDPNHPNRPQGWPLWTPYTSKGENYLHISPSPTVLSHLKAEKMALWLRDIPQALSLKDNSTDKWQCQMSASSQPSMLCAVCENTVVVVLALILSAWAV